MKPTLKISGHTLRLLNAPRFLFPLVAVLAITGTPCLAQLPPAPPSSVSVTFSSGGSCNSAPNPAFAALSLAQRITAPAPVGSASGGAKAGSLSFDDVVLTKNIDDCSVLLYSLLFKVSPVRSVVLSLKNSFGTEIMRITLSDAFITSISEAESLNSMPSERLTLAYRMIVILDPLTGKSSTCDTSARTCG